MKALFAALFATLLLAACAPPTVPDMTYFRLPPPAADLVQRAPRWNCRSTCRSSPPTASTPNRP